MSKGDDLCHSPPSSRCVDIGDGSGILTTGKASTEVGEQFGRAVGAFGVPGRDSQHERLENDDRRRVGG